MLEDSKASAIKPIPFTAPMVRALLDGRKTMTRRVDNARGGRLFPPLEARHVDDPRSVSWLATGAFGRARRMEGRAQVAAPPASGRRVMWTVFYAVCNGLFYVAVVNGLVSVARAMTGIDLPFDNGMALAIFLYGFHLRMYHHKSATIEQCARHVGLEEGE